MSLAQIPRGSPCVILLHTLADGTFHFDWLLEMQPPSDASDTDAKTLFAFRLACTPDELQPRGDMPMQALPLHRRLYLTYEGEVSSNRGSVQRIRSGRVITAAASQARQAMLEIRWDADAHRRACVQHLHVDSHGDDGPAWRVSCVEVDFRAE